MRISAACFLGFLSLSTAASALATSDALAQDAQDVQDVHNTTYEEQRPAVSPERAESMWRFELGYRGSYFPSAGFDPFSTNDFLPQVSLVASRTVFASGPFSFAPGIAWNYGSTSSTARGDASRLQLHRLTVPLEGRVHLGPAGSWGYAFLRVAPGVVAQSARIEDPSAPAPLTKSTWLFATDLSAGYAWPIFPWPGTRDRHAPRTASVWVEADGGYGWTASQGLTLHPDLPDDSPQRVSGVDLGSLSTSGGFFRAALAVAY